MARKVLVDFSLIKELSDSFCKTSRRGFKAKLKNTYNNGSAKKSKKKYEKLRRLLLSDVKKGKKENRPIESRKRPTKNKKIKKSFNQFESESTAFSSTESESSDKSDEDVSKSDESENEISGKDLSSCESSGDSNDSETDEKINPNSE